MDNGLVNLSRLLYQMKQENEKLKEKNSIEKRRRRMELFWKK